MSILLPLYLYPWPGVWDPLYTAATTHPLVNFTVVLNPCSGPCTTRPIEPPYLLEIPKLALYPNIRTLGYVATNYTSKPLSDVIVEIQAYANWTSILNDSRVAVDGIFFDEVPGPYDWRKYDYLKLAQSEVKSWEGLVHNPGTIPDRIWNYMNLTDITIIFENTFNAFLDRPTFDTLSGFQTAAERPKSQLALMLHTLPNFTDGMLRCMVKEMEGMVDWIYVTGNGVKDEYWHSFSSLFGGFVKAVDE
ncbi:Spherulation-specific family 4 [Amylocarpus encephaloides]|uniref:Spherulation-specific family 4 n=1 Tax=Amylocarpus encephaloides TaxID=45428 RepID=A0A9P7Y7W7_9HELO|nr:Spherulation-specific family 4 [Amylocarpus encephaloides]